MARGPSADDRVTAVERRLRIENGKRRGRRIEAGPGAPKSIRDDAWQGDRSPIETGAARGDARVNRPERPVEQIPDDRFEIQPGDAILLIVEDDPHYARIMINLARDKGFKTLLAMRGDDALDLAKQYQPTAVSLDVFLPDMLGWNVLSQLKKNSLTRHIPVQIITLDEDRQHGLARGAFSFVVKPTTPAGIAEALSKIKDFAKPRRKRLLVVEDNKAEQMSISELLGYDDIEIVNTGTGTEALSTLRERPCDWATPRGPFQRDDAPLFWRQRTRSSARSSTGLHGCRRGVWPVSGRG